MSTMTVGELREALIAFPDSAQVNVRLYQDDGFYDSSASTSSGALRSVRAGGFFSDVILEAEGKC